MPYTIEQNLDFILVESEDDYINLWLIMGAANNAIDADPKLGRMERTLAFVGLMLDRGFQAVDLADNGKCKPWPDQGRMAILRRIEREWRALNDEPLLGMMFWFDLPDSKRKPAPR